MSFEVRMKEGNEEKVKELMANAQQLYGDVADVVFPRKKKVYRLVKEIEIKNVGDIGTVYDEVHKAMHNDFAQQFEDLRKKVKEMDNSTWVLAHKYGTQRFGNRCRAEGYVSITARNTRILEIFDEGIREAAKAYGIQILQ